MRVIYKYPIFRFNQQYVELPWNYRILRFGNQEDDMFIWVEVDTDHAKNNVGFKMVGTGQEPPQTDYIGTVILPDGYVWHLYKDLGV